MTNSGSNAEAYEFSPGTTLYSVGWSHRPDRGGMRLATGTFIEQYNNLVHVVRQREDAHGLQLHCAFDHPYPTTKVSWIPDPNGIHADLIGTTGDFLRLWEVSDDDAALTPDMKHASNHLHHNHTSSSGKAKSSSASLSNSHQHHHHQPHGSMQSGSAAMSTVSTAASTTPTAANAALNHNMDLSSSSTATAATATPAAGTVGAGTAGGSNNRGNGVVLKCKLNNDKSTKFCAPLTAFDWNHTDPSLIGTSSIDTTCTVWDIETQKAKTQLIAHDKEVYDFAFAARGVDIFASVGADGSVRLFDLRSLEHSTIIYESPEMTPLLRLRWNTRDPNYLATVAMDNPEVVLLDIRQPSIPITSLDHSTASSSNCVNAVSWAPHNEHLIATGGDRCLALIWNISDIRPSLDPSLSYAAGASISNMQWSPTDPDWISIVLEDKLRVVRI